MYVQQLYQCVLALLNVPEMVHEAASSEPVGLIILNSQKHYLPILTIL